LRLQDHGWSKKDLYAIEKKGDDLFLGNMVPWT
jgi:hypothetical protein